MIDARIPLRGQAPNFGNMQLICASRRHQNVVFDHDVEGARLRRGSGVGTVYGRILLFSVKMCTRYTITKMTILATCVCIAAAARTSAFHFAVKHQTLVASQRAYQLGIPEVWWFDREVEVPAARGALLNLK